MADYRCPYGYGWCEVPYKDCPHWQGTFCELDVKAEKMDELKPCPFCGGEAAFLGETQSIKCKQCGGMFIVTNPFTTRLEAKEAWNRRADNDLALSNT